MSNGEARYCHYCEQGMPAGPDACLGIIPGVSHACCGHGIPEQAYVVIGGQPDEGCVDRDDYAVLRGGEALVFFSLMDGVREEKERLANTPPWDR